MNWGWSNDRQTTLDSHRLEPSICICDALAWDGDSMTCARDVSIADLPEVSIREIRDARQACGCLVCSHTLHTEGVIIRETLEDLR